MTTATMTPLQTLHQIENELKSEILEREEIIRASLISLVAKSHMVILGPPGTAKSDLIKAMSERFCDPSGNGLSYFVYLLTRFTAPEELFGPVSISGMKNDTYERVITGKLPSAQIAFLDEIFKSSSAVLNVLLTILNERVFDNGTKRLAVPLVSLFGASNEMPQEAQDLEALWDRFLIRVEVEYLSEGGFEKLIGLQAVQGTSSTTKTIMSQMELESLQAQAASLPIPAPIQQALVTLRRDLSAKGITASDRRWVQSLRLLQASAVLEGRAAVEEDDLAILSSVLWKDKADRQEISKLVAKLSNPFNAKSSELKDRAAQIWATASQQLKKNPGDDEAASLTRSRIALEALTKIKSVIKSLDTLHGQATDQGRNTKRIEQALVAVKKIKSDVTEASEF